MAKRSSPPTFDGYSSRDVPFVGPSPSPWLLIGEAPGQEEDEFGEPFVGRAGSVLTTCLQEAGIPRSRCRIGNAVPRRPPNNRKPTGKEIAFYRERLAREIEVVGPKVIIALGETALIALTGKRGITKHRGMEITTPEGWLVLPTFHPAYVLPHRSPEARAWLVKDLRRARQLAGDKPKGNEPTAVIISDPALLPEFESPILAYDVETTGLDPLDPEKRMIGIGVADDPDGGYFVLPPAWPALRERFARATRLIAHNGLFDNRWLRREGFDFVQTFDTMIAAYLLDDTRPTLKLERLAVELLDVPPYHGATDEALKTGKAEEVSVEALAERCVRDACYTLRLYYLFRERLIKHPALVAVFKHLLMPSVRLAEDLENAGLPLDEDLLRQRVMLCQARRDQRRKEMQEMVEDEHFNPGSSQQVGKVLMEVLQIPIAAWTPTGRPATGESALAQYRDHPFIRALQDYRRSAKYLSTYYEKWQTRLRNGRVHGSVWIIRSDEGADKMRGTRTGRYSGDQQQVPKQFNDTPEVYRVKDVILAPPGFRLVEVDLSQIELRCAAWIAPEPAMLDAYRSGRDLHIETARDVLGIPNPTEADRSKAKPINFGRLFGMGDAHFQEYALTEYGVKFTLAECAELGRRFFEKYKGLQTYYRRCEREARTTGAIRTPFGRVRQLPDVRSPIPERRAHAFRQAINTPIQSAAHDLNTLTVLEARRRIPPEIARVILVVHDSSLWEVREGYVEQVARTLVDLVRHDLVPLVNEKFGFRITVPLDAEAKAGSRWGALKRVDIRVERG